MEEKSTAKGENKVYKADLHCHPLVHKHYPELAWEAALDKEDMSSIHKMLNLAISRGLDVVAITDHNQFTSAAYAKMHAELNELPIKVLIGAECSVFVDGTEMHVTALNVQEPFYFNPDKEGLAELLAKIRACGGLSILNHPHYDVDVACTILNAFDGVEVYNGVAAANLYKEFDAYNFKGFKTRSSDYHLTCGADGSICIASTQLNAVTHIDESMPALYNILRD